MSGGAHRTAAVTVQIREREAVVTIGGGGLAGESNLVQHGIHEVAAGIARERASGAVGAMRPGSKSHDEHARVGVAESRDGLAPIFPVAVCAALLARNLFAVRHQTRAKGAGNDFAVEDGEPGHRSFAVGDSLWTVRRWRDSLRVRLTPELFGL